MALAATLAVALNGVRAQLVEIEADLGQGLPGMSFTGLADTSVVESRDRIRAALQNSGADWPNRKITVALLPADLPKVGSRFDLAVAVAVLAAAEAVPADSVRDAVWIAELGLDGRLRPVRGVLPAIVAVRAAGVRRVVVAPGNAAEAALVPGLDVRVGRDLREVVDWLTGEGPVLAAASEPSGDAVPGSGLDLAEVAGQALAKRAIELAAAGWHHVFLQGPPGAGKTMLAERLPSLLPPLDDPQALEVTAVHSVAGLLGERARLIRRAPLQAPHHTASVASLVGGGSHLAHPGAISLAHRGILFLDEAPEFAPRALDALRQPLESGLVVLHRGGGTVTYPARFLLVLAANPCPCGSAARECTCPPQARRRYQHRLSGPLLDRIDVRVHVDPVPHATLLDDTTVRETSELVAARVTQA
ncbi:MAG: YifB family Mg chelatase-like AAA ATPase, partial [Jatrophihabitantaceae bacterium]